jgi:hypothetical protein
MKRKFHYLIAILLFPLFMKAQQPNEEQQFGIQFSGFVKNDFFFDTHENVSIREGHFLLYPANNIKDANGSIINNELNFNFLSIQTRLTGKITGPDAFGAKTSGLIEADFFGNENTSFSDLNGFRLRHAIVKLTWKNTELLTGQFWHPLFVPECFPAVISFNTGSPFQPFSRNPQIKISHKINKIKLVAAINSQRDFTNIGGSGELRNAGLPDFNAQIHIGSKNEAKNTAVLGGAGFEYKVVRPRLSSTVDNKVFKVDETLGSMAVMAFGKYQGKFLTIKAQAVYGQNLTDLVMMGGYMTQEITDALTGEKSYTPLNNLSTWFEVHTNTGKHEIGLFGGYAQNLGTTEKYLATEQPLKTRGLNIHHVFRLSPRYVITSGKLKFAAELEYTAAAYATADSEGKLSIDDKAVVTDYESVSNVRLLTSVIYSF